VTASASETATSPRRLLRSSAVVGLGTSASRVTGFVRFAAITYALGGRTAIGGTYGYASQTPSMLYELLLGGVLTATLVPLFVRHTEEHDDEATSAVFTVSAIALAGITVVGIVLAPVIIRLFTLRVEGPERVAEQDVATALLRLFMPMIFFYGLTTLCTALLNARRQFAAAAFAPVLNNIVVIALFLALPRLADDPITLSEVQGDTPLLLLLGLGTTAGIAAVTLTLLPAVRAAGTRLRFLPAWRHKAVTTMARLSGWSVGYVIANQVALSFVLVLANSESGALVYLTAYTFFQLPHGLLAVSLTTTLAPEMASAAGRGDVETLRERLSLGLRLIVVVVLPAAAGYVGLARPVVVALLQRGAFSGSDAEVVADTIVGFAVGLVFFSFYLFSLRAFYALQDTRTPFFLNCFENAVNIVLAGTLYAWLGVPGLALAFSGAYACAAAVTLAVLRRRLGRVDGRRVAAAGGRAAAAGAALGVVTWIASRWLGWDGVGRAAVTTAVGLTAGLAAYVAGMLALRAPELATLRALLPSRRADDRGAGQTSAPM
jgi:putative peptidoglycan lipid II flippase